ncbi:MAG: ATP-dependent Clp protease ATP-binding subunit, partial [Muribaculaceae bacterium]|nr:ATP-dependent Clp protease ATP-binding subunit [Muribaculaceae bacterium]
MNINYSEQLRNVLEESQRQAVRHNNDILTPAHLLLVLMSDPTGRAVELMNKVTRDVSVYPLYKELDDNLFEVTQREQREPAVSELVNRLIKLSVLEARMLKSDIVDVEHLLLALFHNSEVQSMDFMKPFRQSGITYENLYQLITKEAGMPQMGADTTPDGDVDDDDDDEFENRTSGQGAPSRPQQGGNKAQAGSGDTPTLDKYGNDMTRAAEEGRLDPVVGREIEIERLAQILSRRKKNNPVL